MQKIILMVFYLAQETIKKFIIMRKNKSLLFFLTTLILNFVLIAGNFFIRGLFVSFFGYESLGLIGILSNFLGFLTFFELGLSNAFLFSLYKPISINDTNTISSIIYQFKISYRKIGIIIFTLGTLLSIFLYLFIQNTISNISIQLVYFILLIDMTIPFFFSYRNIIINADQNGYKLNKQNLIFTIIGFFLQLLSILILHNLYFYLLSRVLITVFKNLYSYFYIGRFYPLMIKNTVRKLDPTLQKEIKKNINSLIFINIGSLLVLNTDNFFLANIEGLIIIGVLSNYNLVINTFNTFFSSFYSSIKNSLGNFLINSSIIEKIKLFNSIFFINFLIVSFSSLSLYVFLNPFIRLWLGSNTSNIGLSTLYFILLVNFFRHILDSTGLFITSSGLFSPYKNYKFLSILEGFINLIFTYIFVYIFDFGINGVFIGTLLSLIVPVVFMPKVVFNYIFKMSSRPFFIKLLFYSFIFLFQSLLMNFSFDFIIFDDFLLTLIFSSILLIFVFITPILLLFYKSDELKYFFSVFKWIKSKIGFIK